MIKIVVLLVLTLCFACDAASFVPFSTQKSLSKTFLGAKVNKNRKKGKPASKTGGGFGGAAVAQSNKKVRSISGFAGSGTKPLREAANNFDSLLKKHGKDAVSDVYVRSPLNDKDLLWFVGKIVRCLDENLLDGSTVPTENDAVISQKRLILEYAKRELRPQNLGGPFSEGLELWLAPGDSEMDCVQNKVRMPCLGKNVVC